MRKKILYFSIFITIISYLIQNFILFFISIITLLLSVIANLEIINKKKCPFCREYINKNATKCPKCQSKI